MNTLVRDFLAADRFAVVGASKNRSKFGNKVRWTPRSLPFHTTFLLFCLHRVCFYPYDMRHASKLRIALDAARRCRSQWRLQSCAVGLFPALAKFLRPVFLHSGGKQWEDQTKDTPHPYARQICRCCVFIVQKTLKVVRAVRRLLLYGYGYGAPICPPWPERVTGSGTSILCRLVVAQSMYMYMYYAA